jgi:glycosyltransferase involved in cell wall biosynthesis
MYHACLLDLLARPFAGSARRARMVWFLQGSLHSLETLPRSTRLIVRLLALLSPLPDAIAINSAAGRLQHDQYGYRARRWIHLPNGCDTERFRPDADEGSLVRRTLDVADGTLLIMFIGRAHPEKGFDLMLAAAPLLRGSGGLSIMLVGDGTEGTRGSTPRAAWVGLGVRSDVESLLRGADILVLPSRSEGTPNAVIEAMASEVPCVVTDVGDCAELVGPTGVVVAPGSTEALAAGLQRMIDLEPEERRRLGTEARARILEHHSMAVARERYRSLWTDGPR